MKKMQQGFTLIELMIVVAIIGILAAIAIPQYQNYVARSESAAGIASINPLKTGVEDAYARGATPDLAALGIAADANKLGTIAATFADDGTGTITFTFDGAASPKIKGGVHTLTRDASGVFVCTSTVAAEYKPKACT